MPTIVRQERRSFASKRHNNDAEQLKESSKNWKLENGQRSVQIIDLTEKDDEDDEEEEDDEDDDEGDEDEEEDDEENEDKDSFNSSDDDNDDINVEHQRAIYEAIVRDRETSEQKRPAGRKLPPGEVHETKRPTLNYLPRSSQRNREVISLLVSSSPAKTPVPYHAEFTVPAVPAFQLSNAQNASLPEDFGNETYSLEEYQDMLSQIEVKTNATIEDVENGSLVTKSNNSMSKENTMDQDKAMYGRTKNELAELLFRDIFNLKYWHVFVDIGHGIGTLCLHAAMTRGCESRGIEVCNDRNILAKDVYLEEMKLLHQTRKYDRRFAKVDFRHGKLEDPEQRNFILEGDKIFCNNFNDVFGCRSQHKVSYSPNTYIAGLFCQMTHMAEMATLCRLDLPPTKEKVNLHRVQHGLPERDDASFFDMKTFVDKGGDDKLSFTRNPFKIYKYTRITRESQWYCWKPSCPNSSTPIKAWKYIELTRAGGRVEQRVVPVTDCDKCNARNKPSRDRTKTSRYGFDSDNENGDL